ncbi:MAG: response regulator [Chlorobiaceae bacterium]|nr:response regulator [Chlorobiaceae bacterium]
MKSIPDIVVLFVDDETDTINALKRFLRKEPFTKIFVESGDEALKKLEGGGVDILVTDALMPNMSGPELIRAVRAGYPEIISLLVTGSNDVEHIVKSVGVGNIFGFIMKPIEPEPFKKAIAEAIEHYRKRDDR